MAMIEIRGEIPKETLEGVRNVINEIREIMDDIRDGDAGELYKTRELETLDRMIEKLDLNCSPGNMQFSNMYLYNQPEPRVDVAPAEDVGFDFNGCEGSD